MPGPCDTLGHNLNVRYDDFEVGYCYRCGRAFLRTLHFGTWFWTELARVASVNPESVVPPVTGCTCSWTPRGPEYLHLPPCPLYVPSFVSPSSLDNPDGYSQ